MAEPKLLLLSGPTCSGKTTLSEWLEYNFGFKHIRTSVLLNIRINKRAPTRKQLQSLGARLTSREPDWIIADMAKTPDYDPLQTYVIDAIHTLKQANRFRNLFGRAVVHIHLEAPESTLIERHIGNQSGKSIPVDCETVKKECNERRVRELQKNADISINTALCRNEDVQVRVAGLLGLYRHTNERLVDVIIGGQFGSEGKGNIASYLSPEYDYLVRVGGPNAGHMTKDKKGSVFTFRQLPSGSAVSNAKLVIGPGATIDLKIILDEIKHLEIEYDRICIDPHAIIIRDEDKEKERALVGSIASTGSGSGHAQASRILYRGDSQNQVLLAKDAPLLRPYIRSTFEVLDTAYRNQQKVMLEGTQGTGLSIFHGYYPYVTSRDTTISGCLAESGIAPAHVRKIVMVCRTYPIRVANPDGGGTSGPMAQEVTRETLQKRSGLPIEELKENSSVTHRPRRISEFDWELLRRSVALNAPTDIALTFADYISAKNRDAYRYEQLTPETINFIEEVERTARVKVSLISTKFDFRSVIDRRAW